MVPPYENRLCAFVDVLGFRELIRESVRRPELAQKIRLILRRVVEATPVWERDSPEDIIAAGLRNAGLTPAEALTQAQARVEQYSKNEQGGRLFGQFDFICHPGSPRHRHPRNIPRLSLMRAS